MLMNHLSLQMEPNSDSGVLLYCSATYVGHGLGLETHKPLPQRGEPSQPSTPETKVPLWIMADGFPVMHHTQWRGIAPMTSQFQGQSWIRALYQSQSKIKAFTIRNPLKMNCSMIKCKASQPQYFQINYNILLFHSVEWIYYTWNHLVCLTSQTTSWQGAFDSNSMKEQD